MSDLLLNRAHDIETWAEEHMIDSNGVFLSFVDKVTGRHLDDAFFEGFDANAEHLPGGCTSAEFWAYENCGMTTGAYLQALLYRYDVDQDPQTLKKARRCFQALKYIFDLGKQFEEGVFPKIYGNRFSTQTSTDQVLYAVFSMDHFYRYATKAEQKEIDHIIPAMIRFWVRRDYRYTYFNIKDMLWPQARFPSLLLLAFNHSGDAEFKSEYERLLNLGVNQHPGEEQLRPKIAGLAQPSAYEESQHAWLISNMADCTTMDVMELDYLLRHDHDNKWSATWKQSMLQMWNEGKMTLAPDGSIYSSILIDMDTKLSRRPEPIMLPSSLYADLDNWSFSSYIHGASSGWSTMMARAGVQAHYHFSESDDIASTVKHILTSLKLTDLTYYNEPDRFLPQHRFLTNFISGDSVVNWLWAYWQGRSEHLL